MNGTATRSLRLGASVVGLVTLGCVLTGLTAKPAHRGIPLPTDWSHHHLIFSRPGTRDQAARVNQDLRYWQQMYRREQRLALPARVAEVDSVALAPRVSRVRSTKKFHRDWAENLGTGASAGVGNYPAKFSFDSVTANCGDTATPDFVVYSTGLQGSATQASIVAFDNLYSGCTGTVPSIYWAYNTSQIAPAVPGAILTSPVLSLDGKQISFVQTNGTGAAKVVLLKWAASAIETVSLPGVPLPVLPAAYPACPAPCMTTFDLTNRTATPTDDTTSSVFYDYSGDVAWVGDSRGLLHKFHPFFNGTPAEISDAFWPALVSNPLPLSSPVFDRVTNNVFASGVQDGFLYRVDAISGAVVHSRQLDFAINLAGPIVDSARGFVYAFGAQDNSNGCSAGISNCAAVFQLPTNFAALDTGTEAKVGLASPTGPTPTPLFPAGFDNAYLNSVDGTGKLYLCGNTGANATLYQVPIVAGALSDGVAIAVLGTTGSTPTCSPVTDVSDPGATASSPATERIFASVQSNANLAGCTNGCVVSMIDTPWEASKSYALGKEILVTPGNLTVRRIYIAVAPGTSGTLEPHWPDEFGFYKSDPSPGPGAVTWLNQGDPALPIGPWLPLHTYVPQDRILDSNGTVQVVPTTPDGGGISGAAPPVWSTGPGDRTGDGTVNWANAGKLPMLGMPSSGGTSAIIIDNTVSATTLAGASQVYFTTLGDQVCGSTGTGGCAVQASQSALQ